MTPEALEDILVDARAGNEARNVTGLLVYVDGVFLQVLEGERETVLSLMKCISNDSRHRQVKVFHEAEIDELTFGSWRMAYLSATPAQLFAWIGHSGTATVQSVLSELDRNPHRGAQIVGKLLKALEP